MPGFNRRGPLGEGPMTGRRMGYCNNPKEVVQDENTSSANANMQGGVGLGNRFAGGFGIGRGGRGRGCGMGWRNRFGAAF